MAKIEYEDKVALIENPDIPDINKVKADDMNEIKSVVNENAINISTQVDEDYRVNLLHSKNLLPNGINSQTINGLTITRNSNGTLQINGTANALTELVIGYIDFKANTNYFVSGCPSGGGANKYFISVRGLANDYGEGLLINRPSNENKEIFIRVYSGQTLNNAIFSPMINEGSTPSEYQPFVQSKIEVDNEKYTDTINVGSVVDSRSRVNFLKSKNLFTNSNLTNGYLNNNGTITTNNDFRVSDYINVSNMSKITISGNSGGSEKICFYNSSKTFISTVNTLTNTTMTIDVPNNATYVRATIKATNLNIYIIQEGSSIITPSIYVDNEEIYSKPVVLWENSSPSSNFASQTITLNDNISNYEYYEVIYQVATSGNIAINTGKIPTNLGCYMLSISNYMRRRTTGIPSGTSLLINDCYFNNTYGTAGTVQNDNLIPYQILGYK